MKKTLVFAFIAGALTASAQTTYPGGVTGCIARYDFASTGTITSLPDVSGNSNNSSAVNALSATNGFRNAPNKAMAFNGSSSSATIPHASMLEPTALTMVAVVKMNGFYNGLCQTSQILSKGYPHYNPGVYGFGFGDNVYDNNCSIYSPTHMQLGAEFGTTMVGPTAGNYVTTNQWYFVAASYDGTSTIKYYQVPMDVNTYVNNVTPIYTLSNSTPLGTTNTQALTIGRTFNPPFPYYFNGAMEEVVLFNKALSTTEMQTVYDYLWGIVKITSVSSTTLCGSQTFTVNYSVNNSSFFASTNTFSVQLSNATGNFASPTTIGSVTATGGGSITCTVPSAVPNGTGYRIRIVANNVAYTTADNGTNISIGTLAKPNASSNSPVCVGQTLNLSGSSSASGVIYNWNGPGFTSSVQNPTITNVSAANAGIYTLTVSLNGCTSDPDTENVAIGTNVTPTVTGYVSPNDTICSGETIAFQVLVTNGGSGTQYQWMRNSNPIPGETASTFLSKTLSSGDVIHCQVISNGCNVINTINSNSFTVTILDKVSAAVTISAAPGVVLSPWEMVTFTATVVNGGSNPTFQWKRNGQDVIGANSSTWSANNLNNNDTITVAVTSSYPCAIPASASSQPIVVNIKTSVDKLDDEHGVILYPNPNNGAFTVSGNFGTGTASLEVLNITGQVVYSENIKPQGASLRKEITLSSSLPNGIYILKLRADDVSRIVRFSINK